MGVPRKTLLKLSSLNLDLEDENERLTEELVQTKLELAEQLTGAAESLGTTSAEASADIVEDPEDHKCCAEARGACEAVLIESMHGYLSAEPDGTFERFLQKEWPRDHNHMQRSRNGDPAITRSYSGW